MLSSLIRFFTSLTRRGSPALWDQGGEDPLLAMFRKLRFTMEHRRGGKNAKGMLKGEEKRMKWRRMVLDSREEE